MQQQERSEREVSRSEAAGLEDGDGGCQPRNAGGLRN